MSGSVVFGDRVVQARALRGLPVGIPALLATPAAVRFLSCEPMLGLVRLCTCDGARYASQAHAFLVDAGCPVHGEVRIDWVIAGGESGPNAAAREHGWVPPMAWDDDTIDDPAAQPSVPKGITGVAARVADAIELLDSGEIIPEQIAGRLGVTLTTLTQNMRRHAPDRATVFNAALGRWRSQVAAA